MEESFWHGSRQQVCFTRFRAQLSSHIYVRRRQWEGGHQRWFGWFQSAALSR
jgi:hypothetical protein